MGQRNRARETGEAARPTLLHRLEYLLVQAGVFALLSTDVQGAARIGSFLGRLVGLLDRRHRDVAEENLRLAYGPGMAPDDVRRRALRVYENLGMTAAEFVHGPRRLRGKAAARWLRVTGAEEARRATKAGTVILLGAHFGNWEYLVPGALLGGLDVVPVARPLDNPLLDGWVARTRAGLGNLPVSKHGALRGLARSLRDGKSVGMLVDQNGGRHGRLATFFGRPCSTQGAGVSLARRFRTPFCVTAVFRERVGLHTMEIGPPVLVPDDDEGEKRAVDEMNRQLEAFIRRKPEDWMWLHRRWRIKADWGFPVEPTEGKAKA